MHVCEFIVDELTECVRIIKTNKIVETEVLPVTWDIVRNFRKKDGWSFNWKKEYKGVGNQLYYLRNCSGDMRVQGLISILPKPESKYIFMNLIESAPHNFGSSKEYSGVPGNLVAFICKMSFELGMEGFTTFIAKTKLIDHYKKMLDAEMLVPRENKMIIRTKSALKLVNLYYKDLAMTKKQFLKWVDSIPADATLDDIGFIGLPFASQEEMNKIREENDELMKEAIRKHRESCQTKTLGSKETI